MNGLEVCLGHSSSTKANPPQTKQVETGSIGATILRFINLCWCAHTQLCWLRAQAHNPANLSVTHFQLSLHQCRAGTTTHKSLQVRSHRAHRASRDRNSPTHRNTWVDPYISQQNHFIFLFSIYFEPCHLRPLTDAPVSGSRCRTL